MSRRWPNPRPQDPGIQVHDLVQDIGRYIADILGDIKANTDDIARAADLEVCWLLLYSGVLELTVTL